MIEPEWFFSTLAQSVAASIGFVIAFSAALYTSRRARQRERVSNFKREIREFRDDIFDPIETMRAILKDNSNIPQERELYREDNPAHEKSGEIREWAMRQENPHMAYLYINLNWVRTLIITLDSAIRVEEMESTFDELEYPIINIQMILGVFPEFEDEEEFTISGLYHELREQVGKGPSEVNLDAHLVSIYPVLDIFVEENHPTKTEGNTLNGWSNIAEIIANRYYDIDSRKYIDSDLFELDGVGSVLRKCMLLFLFGVIIPTLFLITIPNSIEIVGLPQEVTPLFQTAIITIVGVFSVLLFRDLIQLVGKNEF